MPLTIVRVDIEGESAKALICILEHAAVIEGLTEIFSNYRVFLDPGIKAAIDLGDA